MEKPNYQIIVDGFRIMDETKNKSHANALYAEHVKMSKNGIGVVGGKSVRLEEAGKVIREYFPVTEKETTEQ
jgi:hypothetical protein